MHIQQGGRRKVSWSCSESERPTIQKYYMDSEPKYRECVRVRAQYYIFESVLPDKDVAFTLPVKKKKMPIPGCCNHSKEKIQSKYLSTNVFKAWTFVLWTEVLNRGKGKNCQMPPSLLPPPPPRRCAAHWPVELAMGMKAAGLRLLCSPFSCPSAEDPLKHKGAWWDLRTEGADRKAGSRTDLQCPSLLALAFPLMEHPPLL